MSKSTVKEAALALLAGVLFGAGLLISGMTRPQKVIGFLDLFGAWDASLLLVMIGAIGVHFAAYRLIRGRRSPLLASQFSLPTRHDIDLRLIAGAALFGVGWGLGGYCPGPAVTSIATSTTPVLVFVGAMLLGMFSTQRLEALLQRTRNPPEPATSRLR
jgi:uncharacterized membrane protein YedE/YeeE